MARKERWPKAWKPFVDREAAVTHFIPYEERGRFVQAECGATVRREEGSATPTCARCVELRERYERMEF